METISQLARRFGLARSTLLYYDAHGLLRPTTRTAAGYRLYDAAAAERLAAIVRYRRAGVPLAQVKELLDGKPAAAPAILTARHAALDAEIAGLREQQRVIVKLLARHGLMRPSRALDKAGWVAVLRATGLDEAGMRRWHVAFERMAPQAHQGFLEALGIEAPEIRAIRRWSKGAPPGRARRL